MSFEASEAFRLQDKGRFFAFFVVKIEFGRIFLVGVAIISRWHENCTHLTGVIYKVSAIRTVFVGIGAVTTDS